MQSDQAQPEASFSKYNLSEPVKKSLTNMGFTAPTPIQDLVLPALLGKQIDMIALASTGSGKTAAFGIPLVEAATSTSKTTQALVLCPTRELAIQVSDQIQKLSSAKSLVVATIYGGASYRPQEMALRKGAHIIVATPGRLIDFIEQGLAKIDNVKVLVLDEADEMISMGFQDDLEKILSHMPDQTQKWLFSATMSREIRRIADRYLSTPEVIAINSSQGLSDTIDQVYFTVKSNAKVPALIRVLESEPEFHGIIFCQTKAEVADIADKLHRRGMPAEAIHGDRTQKEREIVLKKFRDKTVRILVATDVAARGLDIKNLTHVINHSIPRDPESYIHRIGRTGRNGQKGIAISLVSPDEIRRVARIQELTGKPFRRGVIPSDTEVSIGKLEKLVAKFMAFDSKDSKVRRATEIVSQILGQMEADIESMDQEEMLGRFLTMMAPQALETNEVDLDYFPPGKVPRELMPKDQRPPREEGRFEGRGGGGSRSRDRFPSRDRRGGGFDRSRGEGRSRSEGSRSEGSFRSSGRSRQEGSYRPEGARADSKSVRSEGGPRSEGRSFREDRKPKESRSFRDRAPESKKGRSADSWN